VLLLLLPHADSASPAAATTANVRRFGLRAT
jgi:hypothetical protein